MKINTPKRREAINLFIQYLAGCAVITFVLRITACSYLESHGGHIGVLQDSPPISNESLATTKAVNPVIESSRRFEPNVPVVPPDTTPTPACRNNIDLSVIFPTKKKLWIQIGTWLNPVEPPADVGMIAFEPEISTVSKLVENRKENVFIVPAAMSDKSGVAIFGGEMNGGLSSSLNVSADVPLSSFEKISKFPDCASPLCRSAGRVFQAVNSQRPQLKQMPNWQPKHTVVPVLSLAEVIPCLIAGRFKHVEFLMCDAQGSDLSIMKGAGAALQHVDKVRLRVTRAAWPARRRGPAAASAGTSPGLIRVCAASRCRKVPPRQESRRRRRCAVSKNPQKSKKKSMNASAGRRRLKHRCRHSARGGRRPSHCRRRRCRTSAELRRAGLPFRALNQFFAPL